MSKACRDEKFKNFILFEQPELALRLFSETLNRAIERSFGFNGGSHANLHLEAESTVRPF
jgi:hypothetical protein